MSHEVYSSLLWHSMAGMQPVTAVPSTQIISSQVPFGHDMILDILEYGIKALLISYNELENGEVI